MEKIEITREEFKKKVSNALRVSLKKEDDTELFLMILLIGAKVIKDIEKELFDEEKEEMN